MVRAELVVFWPVVGWRPDVRGALRGCLTPANFRPKRLAAPAWRAPAQHAGNTGSGNLRRLTHSARTQLYAAGSAARPARGIVTCGQASKV